MKCMKDGIENESMGLEPALDETHNADPGQLAPLAKIWDGSGDEFIESMLGIFEQPDDEVAVTVGGKTLLFRVLKDASEFNALKRRGVEFAKLSRSPEPGSEKWFQAADSSTKGFAFVLAETSLQPKLSASSLLKLAHQAVFGWEALRDAWTLAMVTRNVSAEIRGVEEAKKD